MRGWRDSDLARPRAQGKHAHVQGSASASYVTDISYFLHLFPITILFSGLTSCLTCSQGLFALGSASSCTQCTPGCRFGFFESTTCTLTRDRACAPHQYPAPEGLKYFIVFGQAVTVVIISWTCYKTCLKDRPGLNLGSDRSAIFSIFIGLWDFTSDLTMLALIAPFDPYGLFWVSLSAICTSVAASGLLASFSKISSDLSWPVKFFVFVASCSHFLKSESPLLFGRSPEFWNPVVILVIEQIPQLIVQCLLLYLQGLQGFTWLDWAIWCQSAVFTLLNAAKNILHLRSLVGVQKPQVEASLVHTEAIVDAAAHAVPVIPATIVVLANA